MAFVDVVGLHAEAPMTGCGREKDIQRGNDAELIEHLIAPTLLRVTWRNLLPRPPNGQGFGWSAALHTLVQ